MKMDKEFDVTNILNARSRYGVAVSVTDLTERANEALRFYKECVLDDSAAANPEM